MINRGVGVSLTRSVLSGGDDGQIMSIYSVPFMAPDRRHQEINILTPEIKILTPEIKILTHEIKNLTHEASDDDDDDDDDGDDGDDDGCPLYGD